LQALCCWRRKLLWRRQTWISCIYQHKVFITTVQSFIDHTLYVCVCIYIYIYTHTYILYIAKYTNSMVLSFCMYSCSCTMAWWWWTIIEIPNSCQIINTHNKWVLSDWNLNYTLQGYTNGDASYKDISSWVNTNIWSSYDTGTYWILIWNFKLWEDLNWQYHALLHSTESSLCLGVTNILSSVWNSIFYAFFTAPSITTMLSLDQCRNIWLTHETNE
jgi:hypothetical protein